METFMLAGCADDPEYAHAELIGDLISTKFARVGFVKDMRHPCEWKEFRKQLVLKRGFNCPGTTAVVWRRDGRLVGDVKDFIKVAKDMYDIEYTPDETLLKDITAENLELSEKASQADSWTPYLGKYKKEWTDGISFEGTWQKHKPHKGIVTFKDGSKYEGTLKDGEYHGQGVIRYANGAKFVGIFSHGKKTGIGRYEDAEGNTYDGYYYNDMCHGKGTRKWKDGRSYVGVWQYNQATGQGTEVRPNGQGQADEYSGAFVAGKRHGAGNMTFINGDVYEGDWHEGKMDGEGSYSWADGKLTLTGKFKNDMPCWGMLTFPDGGGSSFVPGEIALSTGTDWFDVLQAAAMEWYEGAKERKAKEESPAEFPIQDWSRNAMCSTLTEEIWADVRNRVTAGGVTAYQCISPGIDKKKSHQPGLVAGDSEAYLVFRELFDAVIRNLHNYDTLAQKHVPDFNVESLKQPINQAMEVVQFTKIRIDRCIAKIPTACVIDLEDRRRVEDLVAKALLASSDEEIKGDYYPMSGSDSYLDKPAGMSQAQQASFVQDGIGFQQADCWDSRNWPDGRGVYCTTDKQLWVNVNMEEHLSFCVKVPSFGIQAAFSRILRAMKCVEDALQEEGDSLSYAFCDTHGFLLANPESMGSGMRIFVNCKLPRLAKRNDLKEIAKKYGVEASPVVPAAAPSKTGGAKQPAAAVEFVNVSVPCGPGVAEVGALNTMVEAINQLARYEKSLASGKKDLWMIDQQPRMLLMEFAPALRDELRQESKNVAQALGIKYISSQELVKIEADFGTEPGKKAKEALDAGLQVDPAVICQIVLDRITSPDCQAGGFILEGFPQNLDHVEAFTKAKMDFNKVVIIDSAEETLCSRLTELRFDPETGTEYHLTTNPPPEDEAVKKRLDTRVEHGEDIVKKNVGSFAKAKKAVHSIFHSLHKSVPGNVESADFAAKLEAYLQEFPA